MKKPIYKHQDFIINKEYERTDNKRYWLELTINNDCTENIIVIMKNPSRATGQPSDRSHQHAWTGSIHYCGFRDESVGLRFRRFSYRPNHASQPCETSCPDARRSCVRYHQL